MLHKLETTSFTDGIEIMIEPMTPKRFSKLIEDIVNEKRVNYMDAVLIYCDEHQLEPDDIKKFVSKTLKDKIAVSAQEMNYLPKVNQLPL